MMEWMTAGSSHGKELAGIITGMPAGVRVTEEDLQKQLWRRRQGAGRGARQTFETDEFSVSGGLRAGFTTGAPITVVISNQEWPKWKAVMDPFTPLPAGEESARGRPLTRPRPGHADLAGAVKFQLDDARDALERASARETAVRVALGTFALNLLKQAANIEIISQVRSIGPITSPGPLAQASDHTELDASAVRCLDPKTSERMVEFINQTRLAGDTCGGIIEVVAYGLPVGLGSYAQAKTRLDADLAAALMSIPAIKGVEIGDGFALARQLGSSVQDAIEISASKRWQRRSNHGGGIEGGISNGEALVLRAAVKPIPTVPRGTQSVDWVTGQEGTAHRQRSDTCAVVPAAVVSEHMVALTLATHLLQRFGGDTLDLIQTGLKQAGVDPRA